MKAILYGGGLVKLVAETENEFKQLEMKSDPWDSQLIEPGKTHPFGALKVYLLPKPDRAPGQVTI